MSSESIPILEAILRLCARAAPGAWYPRVHAQQTNTEADALFHAVEWLWLEGLVRKAEGSPQTGTGITLTPLGERVVDDPEALDRLRRGLPVDATSTGGVVRESLMTPVTPVVTRLLLLANFAVFAWGAVLAQKMPGVLSAYLTGFVGGGEAVQKVAVAYSQILHTIGSVSAIDLVRGEWWRLLSCTFVHGGILHLGMNMYALYAIGAFAEQTWGRWRYLAIYLIGGWGGSCYAMSEQTTLPLVGASGALCGILGAEGVWVLIYGRHLPRHFARRARGQMLTNFILVVFMSMLPSVSWRGHLGGALAGAAAALVLHFQRFGPRPMRVLGVVALVPLVWGCWAYLSQQRATSKKWQDLEYRQFNQDHMKHILDTMRGAIQAHRKEVTDVIDRHPSRREDEDVQKARAALSEWTEELNVLARRLETVGPYRNEEVEKARTTAIEYARERAKLYRLIDTSLAEGTNWKKADEKGLDAQWEKVRALRKEWESLLE